MESKYNHNIEDWWRHLGTFDRENVTPFIFMATHEDACDYLQKTDDWWESLSYEEKVKVFEDFFAEY